MSRLIVDLSRYVILLFMVIFTLITFSALKTRDPYVRRGRLGSLMVFTVFFNITCFAMLFFQTFETDVLVIFGLLMLYIIISSILYHVLYPASSLLLVYLMNMILSVGIVIQTRLGRETALKQLIIACLAMVVSLIIPVIIRKAKKLENMGAFFAVVGILLLGAVFVLGGVFRGGRLSIEIFGITFQFSAFVKITFVFFIAAMLNKATDFAQVFRVTIVAGIHVLILVASKDLGAALIYFVAYIVMVVTATRKFRYFFVGVGGMAAASVAAYRLFSHIRVRVAVWMNPFADYSGTGYQIIQALFSLCAGGWFGTGLFNGTPEMIPLVRQDFTFAAICEEMGILFAICLVALCLCLYLLIVSIAVRLEKPFYKLIALGLGVEYAFQVFLTVGGTTKFIPMTGVTLPLVSYGGSSLMCTMFMLAIVQGLYIIRHEEDPYEEMTPEEMQELLYEEELRELEEEERQRQEQLRRERELAERQRRERERIERLRQQQRASGSTNAVRQQSQNRPPRQENGRQNIDEDFFANTKLKNNEPRNR